MSRAEAQSLSGKRAQVEFHKFASLGDFERVIQDYAEENLRRRGILVKHRDFIGPLSRTPVRIAGDALNLPFRDGSIRMIAAFQMLHLFMDIESVFLEVKRVLAPAGGEPLPGASLRDLRSRAGLGGTLAAVCRKPGVPEDVPPGWLDHFETLLRCPDCHGSLTRAADETLNYACGYSAPNQGGVYNLLPSSDRSELYPGDRDDVINISVPGHQARLLDGWHKVEGVFGNQYRWLGARASAVSQRPPDKRKLSVNLSMIRLLDRD